MRAILAALLILQIGIAAFLYWQSEYPSPSTRVGGTHEKIEPLATKLDRIYRHRGTKENPIVVEVAPAEKTQDQTEYEQYEHFEKPLAERRVAYATVALSAFTFLLTIFTALLWGSTERLVKQTESVAKQQERAYLICGGVFGVPKPRMALRLSRSEAQLALRPKATDFEGPWRMVIRNYGRTPGFVRKIEWGLCPKGKFIEDKSISQIIREGLLADWMGKTIEIKEVIPPSDTERWLYRHIEFEERTVNTVFFGKMFYEDIFHEAHHSTWAIWHRREHTDTLGSSFAEDWS
jgi:hypothetical protein